MPRQRARGAPGDAALETAGWASVRLRLTQDLAGWHACRPRGQPMADMKVHLAAGQWAGRRVHVAVGQWLAWESVSQSVIGYGTSRRSRPRRQRTRHRPPSPGRETVARVAPRAERMAAHRSRHRGAQSWVARSVLRRGRPIGRPIPLDSRGPAALVIPQCRSPSPAGVTRPTLATTLQIVCKVLGPVELAVIAPPLGGVALSNLADGPPSAGPRLRTSPRQLSSNDPLNCDQRHGSPSCAGPPYVGRQVPFPGPY